MAGFGSAYLSNLVLSYLFGGTGFTPPATYYLALLTGLGVAGGGQAEVSGNGYARLAVANNTTNFPAATGGIVKNAVDWDWGAPTGSGWGSGIAGVGIYDAAAGGNLYAVLAFTPSARSGPAGVHFVVPANSALITLGYANPSTSIATYAANLVLSRLFGGTSFTAPATWYVALHTTMPTTAGGGVEPSGNGYARLAVANNTANFPAATGQQSSEAIAYDFGSPTGSGWGTIVGAAYWDAPTGGNLWFFGPFTTPRTAAAAIDFSLP